MIITACVALAILGWAVLPADPSGGAVARWCGVGGSRGRVAVRPTAVVGVVAAVAGVAGWAPRLLVWLVPGLVVTLTVGWLVHHERTERVRTRAAEEVVAACQAISSQLRVGDIPARALTTVAPDNPLLAQAAAAQAIGGDVPAALRDAARRPGCEGLAALARGWQLCELTGAPIAATVSRVADGLRARAATERLVAAELATARASGRLMAGLPLLGLALGFMAGGNPIEFLLSDLWGRLALAVASCLVCLGLVWTALLEAGSASGRF